MKCPECGSQFSKRTVTQKYCSTLCGDRYRRKHKRQWPSITFECAECGRKVVTEEGQKDMRTRFCHARCERKFWRHPPYDGTSARTNFRSIEEYASWERMTNES